MHTEPDAFFSCSINGCCFAGGFDLFFLCRSLDYLLSLYSCLYICLSSCEAVLLIRNFACLGSAAHWGLVPIILDECHCCVPVFEFYS